MKKMTAGGYTPKTFSEWYMAFRRRACAPLSMFVRDICVLCMCCQQTVRLWILGVQKPDALKQKTISEYMGVPVGELFPVEGEVNESD